MKTALSATVLILSLAMTAAAHADGRDHHRHEDRNEHQQRHDRGDWRADHRNDRSSTWNRQHHDRYSTRPNWQARDWRGHEWQHTNDRWHRDYRAYDFRPSHRFEAGRYYRPYGYVQHVWRHGEYLPHAYCAPRYVIDYRTYGLRQPPYGYRWVRVDGDVMLTAIATGLIVGAVYDVF